MLLTILLAQAGSSNAVEVLQDALLLSEDTRASWQKTWDLSLTADPNTLWAAIVAFSLGIAAFALLYMAIRDGDEIMKNQSWGKLVEMITWPFIVVFMLGNNGLILSGVVLAFRGVGQSLLDDILRSSLGGVTMQTAIQNVNLDAVTIARIRQVFGDCDGLVGAQLQTCFDNAQVEAEAMITAAREGFPSFQAAAAENFLGNSLTPQTGSVIETLGDVVDGARVLGQGIGQGAATNGIDGAFASILQSTFLPLVELILYTLQWVAINLSEAALLLTALFAPIAIALSLMPIAGRMIWAWAAGFVGILAYQLGYNILVGLMAFVIINLRGTSESLSGLGFLFFSALGSPWIALQIGQGGGVSLYQGLSRQASATADAVAGVIRVAARAATGLI
jgi:hypothetical protein